MSAVAACASREARKSVTCCPLKRDAFRDPGVGMSRKDEAWVSSEIKGDDGKSVLLS
jgi:hypothetical protein